LDAAEACIDSDVRHKTEGRHRDARVPSVAPVSPTQRETAENFLGWRGRRRSPPASGVTHARQGQVSRYWDWLRDLGGPSERFTEPFARSESGGSKAKKSTHFAESNRWFTPGHGLRAPAQGGIVLYPKAPSPASGAKSVKDTKLVPI